MMTSMERDLVSMSVYIPREMYGRLRILAASKGQGVSPYVKILIAKALEELKPNAR